MYIRKMFGILEKNFHDSVKKKLIILNKKTKCYGVRLNG